jgi:hypothetical protein
MDMIFFDSEVKGEFYLTIKLPEKPALTLLWLLFS